MRIRMLLQRQMQRLDHLFRIPNGLALGKTLRRLVLLKRPRVRFRMLPPLPLLLTLHLFRLIPVYSLCLGAEPPMPVLLKRLADGGSCFQFSEAAGVQDDAFFDFFHYAVD